MPPGLARPWARGAQTSLLALGPPTNQSLAEVYVGPLHFAYGSDPVPRFMSKDQGYPETPVHLIYDSEKRLVLL